MRNLEEEQRKMRERVAASNAKKTRTPRKPVQKLEELDLDGLRRRVAELETENAELRLRITNLMSETRPQSEHSISERERRHMFFKYSNVRRY